MSKNAADIAIQDDLGFGWVSRADVGKTRPALRRAEYRCECCRREDDLRVVEGYGQLAVLCVPCALKDGFKRVLACRKAERRSA